jgi:DNA polymerase-1
MTRPDKDVANACIAQWHATIDGDAAKSRYYFRTFEGPQASIKQQWPPKGKNATSSAHELLDYCFVTTVHELHAVLEELAPYPAIGISIETTGPDPFIDRMRAMQLAVSDQPVALVGCDHLPCDAVVLLCEFFCSSATKVVHDGKILLKFLRQIGIDLSPPYFDTMLASHLVKGGLEATHDLKSVAKVYLNEDVPNMHSSFSTATFTEGQLQHAAHVARVTMALHEVLMARLEEAGLVDSMQLECACLPAVVDMELNGMPIDMTQWQELQDCYTQLEEETAFEVCSKLMKPGQRTLSEIMAINLDSPRQVKAALKSVGVPVRNVREDELLKYEDVHPAVASYLRYKRIAKLKNTFLDALPTHVHPKTGRIHPDFKQIGTVNGRFSCQNPNLQQVPRDRQVRRCFVADPGNTLIIADYAQFELRVAADISGDTAMISAFRQGQDLHRFTASLILDIPIARVTKEERMIAKVLNIGLIYGMGARSLRRYANYIYGVQFTLEEAVEFRRRFFTAYSGLRAFHRRMSTSPMASVRTLSGRIRLWPEGREPKLTELLNTRVQGTAADIMKRALSLLHVALTGTDAKLLCCIHDELLVEAPKAHAEEVAEIVEGTMKEAGSRFLRHVPLDVEVVLAENWGGEK